MTVYAARSQHIWDIAKQTAKQQETHTRVDFVWYVELLAGVHDDWCNGWIVSVADARKQMVNHLQQIAKVNMLLMQGSPRHMKFGR